MTTPTYPPGFQFQHPTQGLCTVTRVTPKSIRYTSARPAGFSPIPHTTTPGALTACLDAGVLTPVTPTPEPR